MSTTADFYCFRCNKKLEPALPEKDGDLTHGVPICDGTVWTSHGNYGSTIYDPAIGWTNDNEEIELYVCDECLKSNADVIKHVTRESTPRWIDTGKRTPNGRAIREQNPEMKDDEPIPKVVKVQTFADYLADESKRSS